VLGVGFASFSPKETRLVPQGWRETTVEPGERARFDFGVKRAGIVYMRIPGGRTEAWSDIRYAYAADERIFAALDRARGSDAYVTDRFPTVVRGTPAGVLAQWERAYGSADVYRLENSLSALRWLEIDNRSEEPVRIAECWLEYTAIPYGGAGGFECDDSAVNEAWAMGIYTVELCTQPSRFTQRPLAGPFSDYAIWDGVRRDKDVWGGDLRPASLVWLYAFDRPEVVKNTLEVLLSQQHAAGDEEGIIPGSGAYGQLFYEWTMWTVVNLWEYAWITGDLAYVEANRQRLIGILGWLERRAEADGLIDGLNSWMYSVDARGKISGLAMAQKAAWDALSALFGLLGDGERSAFCLQRSARTKQSILRSFAAPDSSLLTMLPPGEKPRDRFALDGNLWAVLHDVADRPRSLAMLQEIRRRFWTERGSINLAPPFDDEADGAWWWDALPKESAVWRHNNTVWPYMAAYEVMANFHVGDIARGLEVLRTVAESHLRQGHATYWEMMYPDGSLPFGDRGDLLSLCHAWGGTGSYALQAYVGGIRPSAPGFRRFAAAPELGPLRWVKAKVPTLYGPIELEAEATADGRVRGVLTRPAGTEATAAEGIEVRGTR
jgi:hypothetical protein